MSTINREQAQKIIEAADEFITALAGANEDVHPESDNMLRLWDDLNDRYAPPEVVRELARIALASLEAEPVGFIVRNKETGQFGSWMHSKADWFKDDGYEVLNAYIAPPAPVSVPAELTREEYKRRFMEEDDFDATFRGGWNACRAAMLQGADDEIGSWHNDKNTPTLREAVSALRNSGVDIDAEKILTERDALNSPVITDDLIRRIAFSLVYLAADEKLRSDEDSLFALVRQGIDVVRRELAAPQQATDALESALFGESDDACRAAMFQGAEPDFREISNSSTKHFRENTETSTKCWCHTCRPVTFADSRFVVCPDCGNKRCPHANDHRNACTGSNEPGQEGSAYPAAPQHEVKNG